MMPERVEWHLSNWAHWVAAESPELWYPRRSAVLMGSMHSDFDALVAEVDSHCAATVEALVQDLTPAQRAALEHRWLGTSWRFPRHNLDELLRAASDLIGQGLDKRGIV